MRLIRSKGVGVYFITQTPKDIDEDVLGQLGNRVQHALRAFTPDDAKALSATVKTFPKSPFYDLEQLLTQLGIGEAAVTILSESGVPTPVVHTRLRPPVSTDGAGRRRRRRREGLAALGQVRHPAGSAECTRDAGRAARAAAPPPAATAAEAERAQGGGIRDRRAARARSATSSTRAQGKQLQREVVRGVFGMLKKSLRMSATSTVPTLADVRAAARRIAPYLPRTAFRPYPALSELVGTEVWVKHENHLPTAAFKVRGGVNLVAQLSAEERGGGLVSASTGNHGQSIAYAARLFDVRATICVPEGANQLKVAAIRALGAGIVVHGADFDDAREHCERLAAEHGYRYVHSGNEPHLIAGVATATLELLEAEPGIDVIIVPVGGGSGAAGACTVAKALPTSVQVIGVQSEAAPAAYRSWREGALAEDRMGTAAEGLATRVGFELPQQILREHLDDFVLVSEDDLRDATLHMICGTSNLVEPAGASPLAAALKLRDRLAGKRVALIESGGTSASISCAS